MRKKALYAWWENLKQNYEQLDYVIINDGSKDHTRKSAVRMAIN
jgi:hypothetical protein